MAFSFTKPIIVEFNGLPGSGKTSLANLFRTELESLGVKVFTKYYKYTIPNRRYLPLFMPKYYRVLYNVDRLSRTFPTSKELYLKLSFVNFIHMYNTFISDSNSGVLLIDQGIVQALLSLAYDDLFPDSIETQKMIRSLLEDCHLFNLPIFFINCSTSVELSKDRIRSRPRKNGAFRLESVENDSDLTDILKIQDNNLKNLRNILKDMAPNRCFYLNMDNPLNVNVALLSSFLKSTN